MTREEAIKLLEYPMYKWSMDWSERDDGLSYTAAIEMAIDALREPKRERGEWKWNGKFWECSVCRGNRFHDLALGMDSQYCGRCGADMRPEGGADRDD